MKCCPECFGDRHLSSQTFASHPQKQTGRCDYCQSTDVSLLEPSELREQFETVVSIYLDDNHGLTLVELLQQDWLLLSRFTRAEAKELLGHVLGDANLAEKKCARPMHHGPTALERWQEFRDELMYSNRYFPRHSFGRETRDRLVELFSYLLLIVPRGAEYCRARRQADGIAFEVSEMGSPPKRVSTHGRANPAGIPYLYLASDAHTAVSELRPHTGERACVASFHTQKDITLVDLRDPRKTVSPFQLGEEQKIAQLLTDLKFLEFVQEELTRPVLPRSAAIDYVPTQYVCELIKAAEFDGVAYRSSVGTGHNVALFREENARAVSVSQTVVRKVTVSIDEPVSNESSVEKC